MRALLFLVILLVACTPPQAAPATGGQQQPGCICTAVYAPVCGSDGKTYSNSCMADCASVTFVQGEC